jgi:hypothetical protein
VRGTKAENRVGKQANLPKKVRVDPRADLVGQAIVFKTELYHLADRGSNQTELQLKGNAAASW